MTKEENPYGDERIDPLKAAAILTDTQIRIAFAPQNPKSRITAMKVDVREKQVQDLALYTSTGTVHLQIKAGFGRERHMELTLPEVLLLRTALEKFVMQMPTASVAKPQEGSDAVDQDN